MLVEPFVGATEVPMKTHFLLTEHLYCSTNEVPLGLAGILYDFYAVDPLASRFTVVPGRSVCAIDSTRLVDL